jgi:hypothetical protein
MSDVIPVGWVASYQWDGWRHTSGMSGVIVRRHPGGGGGIRTVIRPHSVTHPVVRHPFSSFSHVAEFMVSGLPHPALRSTAPLQFIQPCVVEPMVSGLPHPVLRSTAPHLQGSVCTGCYGGGLQEGRVPYRPKDHLQAGAIARRHTALVCCQC